MSAPYQAIRCADGYITLGARQRSAVPAAVRRARPSRVGRRCRSSLTTRSRVRNRAALAALIEAITTHEPRAHWLALFDANDIPCGPINDYAQVFADPQVLAREMVVEIEHPTLGPCGRSARRSR